MKLFVTLFSVSCFGMLLSGCSTTPPAEQQPQIPQVCFEEQCWNVEIADEVPEQQRGLMQRTDLDKDAGMLFVFPKTGSRQFWMKDTLIPLDIIWLDGAWKVIYIAENTPPCETQDNCPGYGPVSKNALFVLELNAGQAAMYWITTWSQFILPN